MTEAAVAADAAPEPVVAPEAQAQPPQPVHSDMAEVKEIGEQKRQEEAARAEADKIAKKEQKPKKPVSIRDSMKAADEKLRKDAEDKGEEKPKAEAKPDAKDEPKKDATERERGEDGKFKAKEAENTAEKPEGDKAEAKPADDAEKQPSRFHEAPKRFSEDAKAEWEKAPESVKAEAHRAISEMERGINQYREVVEPLKPYLQLAHQHNVRIEQAMENYVNLERTLLSDPERGLQMVADYAGINLRDYAAKLLNQTPEQVQSNQDNTIRELRAELSQLKQQLGGVTQTIQEQRTTQTESMVRDFAAQHSRFDELASDIEFFLKSGRTSDLSEAYQLAERLNPAPVKASPPPEAPAPAPEAQTLKGSKSISGAPSAGSSPARSEPSKSIRDALRKAASKAG